MQSSGCGSGSATPVQEDTGAEEVCAGCLRSPLDVSLVLTCSHRLCLNCAAHQLKEPSLNDVVSSTGGGHTACCPICLGVTDVDPLAAQHLKEHRLAITRGIHQQTDAQQPQQKRSLGNSNANTLAFQASPQVQQARFSEALLCGQCEADEAEVECVQCGEFFCSRCAAEVHRAGRMREHRMERRSRYHVATAGVAANSVHAEPVAKVAAMPSSPRRTVESQVVYLSPRGTAPASSPSQPTQPTTVHTCPRHQSEKLKFYCMDAEGECLCAECAVEAARQGRDVVKVEKAYQSLSASMDETIANLKRRSDEQERLRKEAEVVRVDLETIIRKGKQGVQDSFRRIHALLVQKEAELLAGVGDVESSMSRALQQRIAPATPHASALQDVRGALRKIDAHDDEEVRALNAFSAVRQTVAKLVDPQTGVDRGGLVQAVGDLQAELRTTLDAQVEGVMALGSKIKEIRKKGAPTSLSAS